MVTQTTARHHASEREAESPRVICCRIRAKLVSKLDA
jgi:hypothetical protein